MTREEFDGFFFKKFEYARKSCCMSLAYELKGQVEGVMMCHPDWTGLTKYDAKICKELINNPEWRRKVAFCYEEAKRG